MNIRFVGPVVTEINPQTLFDSTGDVTKWAQARRAGLVRRAKREAPNGADSGRTRKSRANPEPFGSLIKGIQGSTNRVGPLQVQIILESTVRYSIFVLKGTNTIYGKQSRVGGTGPNRTQFLLGGTRKTMYLPPNLGYKGGVPVSQVSGQKANDFLSRAVNGEAARHPALLGYDAD